MQKYVKHHSICMLCETLCNSHERMHQTMWKLVWNCSETAHGSGVTGLCKPLDVYSARLTR